MVGQEARREITVPDVLAMVRRIEGRGAIELAHVTKRVCGQIVRYAIATGRAARDLAADLIKGALQPVMSEHFAAGYRPEGHWRIAVR